MILITLRQFIIINININTINYDDNNEHKHDNDDNNKHEHNNQ